jgi:hypothetical protein
MQNRNQRILGLIAFAVLSSTTIISASALQKSFAQNPVTIKLK